MTTPIEVTLDELLGHEAWLRSLLRSLLNEGEVDDVLQQTWMTALRSPPTDKGAIKTWLATVAQNYARKTRRSELRRTTRESIAAQDESLPSTEDTLMQLAVQRRITESVHELDEPYRTTILLRYYHHLSTAEIAGRMATNENNVRQRLFRGHTRLRQELEVEYGKDWQCSKALLALALPKSSDPLPGSATHAGIGRLATFAAMSAVMIAAITYAFMPEEAPQTSGRMLAGASPQESTPNPIDQNSPRQSRSEVIPPLPPVNPWRGRVIDTSGISLANIPIGISYEPNGSRDGTTDYKLSLTGALRFLELGRTDSRGQFTLSQLKPGMILRVGGSYAPVRSWLVGKQTNDLVLIAARKVAIAGTVVTQAGEPMADTEIHAAVTALTKLSLASDDTLATSYASTTSDHLGRFRLSDLPAGQMELSFTFPIHLIRTYAIKTHDEAGVRVEMRRIMNTPRHIEGIVVDRQDRPLAGIRVGLHNKTSTTDATGTFSLVFGPVDYRPMEAKLFVSKRGMRTVIKNLGPALFRSNTAPQKIVFGDSTHSIHGELLTADGKPSPDTLVFIWDGTSTDSENSAENLAADETAEMLVIGGYPIFAGSKTDSLGRFAITGLFERDYKLRIYDPSNLRAYTTEPITAGSKNVTLTWPADLLYRLQGNLVSGDGSPAGKITVSTGLITYELDGNSLTKYRRIGTTDSEGRFKIRSVPRYDSVLRFSGEGYITSTLTYYAELAQPGVKLSIDRACKVRITGIPITDESSTDESGIKNPVRLRFRPASPRRNETNHTRRHAIDGTSTAVLTTGESTKYIEFLDDHDEVIHTMRIDLHPGQVTSIAYR